MPSKSPAQRRLMRAVAHNAKFAEKVGIPQSVGREFYEVLGEERGDEATVDVADKSSRWSAIVRHMMEDEEGKPDLYNGKPILDHVFSREDALNLLEEYRMDPKRGEEDFWKQMMNMCVSPTGRKFEEFWFDTWIPQLPGGVVFSAFVCDTANKDEQVLMRGDFTVVWVVHFDSYGHLYVTDGLRSDRMRGADLIRELMGMQQRCEQQHGISVHNFIKEKVGEDTFFGWVQSEFNRNRSFVTTIPVQVRGQGKKYVRIIEALQHPAQARQIHFVHGLDPRLHKVLVDEATHLGQWSHDDAVDAMSLAFHPQIRIRPTAGLGQEWRVPTSTRLRQLSTPDTVPARMGVDTTVEGEKWRGRNDGRVLDMSDGTFRSIPNFPKSLRSWKG